MRPLIIANWKCNPTSLNEAKRLFNLVKRGVGKIKNVEVVICPPFLYLPKLFDFFTPGGKSQIKLGVQNTFWEDKGAFTGEISPPMLKNMGVEYVILGHSERRQHLRETDEMINKKIKAVIKTKLTPILCIGETKEEREKGKIGDILKKQIVLALEGVSGSKLQISGLVIAYEPIWAIGSGSPCDLNESMTSSLIIKKILVELYNKKINQTVRILYGGSVNSKNAAAYIKGAGMQGLLVGGASLKPEEFVKIVKNCRLEV